MKFELDILDAKCGDCIIVNFSRGRKTKHILIDGGYNKVYEKRLKPRLKEMEQRQLDETLKNKPIQFEFAMLSHIDQDHIMGFIDLTKEMLEAKENGTRYPAKISEFWYNSFSRLTEDKVTSNIPPLAQKVATASLNNDSLPFDNLTDRNSDGRARHILASVNQGNTLSRNVNALRIPFNRTFSGKLALSGMRYKKNRMTIDILGPNSKRIEALQEKWKEETNESNLAALTDNSVANLSSIIALMTFAGKSILFTGDARGDDIISGLQDTNLGKDGIYKVDVLKMPHHGSKANVDEKFFQTVVADVYVYSANGKHDNPDAKTLKMMRNSRENSDYTVVLTNEMTEKMKTQEARDAYNTQLDELKKAGVTVLIRDPDKHSICLDLLQTPVKVC